MDDTLEVYSVTIDDTVMLKDFNNNFEIVEQKGEILKIKLRSEVEIRQ